MRRFLLATFAVALFAAPAAFAQYDAAGQPSLVDVVTTTDDLSTLATAVSTAGLVDALEADGPFTVFAPTNDAFGALPEGTVETLLQDDQREQLTGVLAFHVVPGSYTAANLSDGQQLRTLSGETLVVRIDGENVTVNGATVVMADVEASNGVAHVIDGVLLPGADAHGY